MDIRVGSTRPVDRQADRRQAGNTAVEARVLAIRSPRRRGGNPPPGRTDRREAGAQRDPVNGRVLVLLIPDGGQLPEGLASGAYRVFLRFARR